MTGHPGLEFAAAELAGLASARDIRVAVALAAFVASFTVAGLARRVRAEPAALALLVLAVVLFAAAAYLTLGAG